MASNVVSVITSENCFSAGDALRHVDTLDVIKDDFVLISGDVISNIKLGEVVKKHKARAKQDKRNMMTVVMKQVHWLSVSSCHVALFF